MTGRNLSDEEIHEPAEEESSSDHDEKQGDEILDLFPLFVPSNEGQNQSDECGIENHGKNMTLEYHFFFPDATSKASRATR